MNMKERKPNIIIFMADQWRGDYAGIYGHPFIKTPNYDRMTEDCLVFTQAFTVNPICSPTRCSCCTGWYPHTRSHRNQDYLVGSSEPHLFSYLKEAGYHVAWGGKNDMLTGQAIADSVDTLLQLPEEGTRYGGIASDETQGKRIPYTMEEPEYYSFYFGKMEEHLELQRDVQTVRAAQEFLRNPPAEPFCLWINTTFPHPPYAVPEPYFSMYDPHDMDDPIPVTSHPGEPAYKGLVRKFSRSGEYSEDHLSRMKAVYCAMITMVDQLYGDLLVTLKEEGLYDSTAVFMTSDHGNYTGDYGLPEKWFIAMDDPIMRVPLAVRIPGQRKCGVSDALVHNMDIFGTILDLVGIEPKRPHFARSMLPIVDGELRSIRDFVYADAGSNLVCEEPLAIEREIAKTFTPASPYYPNPAVLRHPEAACRSLMIRDREWKYIWRQQDTDELYHLADDPHEQKNLLALPLPEETARVKNSLQAELLRWFVETGDALALAEL